MDEDLLEEEVRLRTPNPLTRRHILSEVAGLYDPIGLVTPAKQKGTILIQKSIPVSWKQRSNKAYVVHSSLRRNSERSYRVV